MILSDEEKLKFNIKKTEDLLSFDRYEEALEKLNEVLNINPWNIEALQYKGSTLNYLGKYKEVIDNSDRVLKMYLLNGNSIKNLYVLNSKGYALRKLGNYSEAIKIFDEVLEINPKYVDTLNNKGCVLEALGEYEEAIKLYDKVLEIDPKYEYAINNKKNASDNLLKQRKSNNQNETSINYKKETDTLEYFLENDLILKKLDLNLEKIEALKTILTSKNTLITARAGTGKSTLLCVLIYILTQKYNINKNNILLLSFNKSVKEKNEEDLKNKCSVNNFFGVHTFDGLAYQVVKTPGKVLDILSGMKLTNTISSIIQKQSLLYRLKYWWYLNELDKEYKIDTNIYTSFLGEDLKSYGEKFIANFLFEHGLDYEYEPVMRWGENQYRPDFEITQGNLKVIIEYFGMTNPEYLEQAKKKKDHWKQQSNHKFIEMSIEDFKGEKNNPKKFLDILEKKLNNEGLTLRALSENEKTDKIFKSKVSLKKIADVTLKFINFAQVQCLSPNDIFNRLEDKKYTSILTSKDKFFNDFANNVYIKFIEELEEKNLYDFSKVRKHAIDIILSTNGECSMNLGPNKDIKVKIKDLRWILMDEFQDYSPSYHEIVNAIRTVNPDVRFVCVGDDWQAINGFAGSDTKYMSDYEDYFSDMVKVNLITNFRSNKNIVDIGNNLMEGLGIKAVATENSDKTGSAWVNWINKAEMTIRKKADFFKTQVYFKKISSIISEYPKENITILHRTNKIFNKDLTYFLADLKQELGINNKNNINISTIHQYKGKEDDVIIFINVTKFNHPLMHPDRSKHYILGQTDEKIKSEERRLFYVAITRAKKAIYLITDIENQSSFIGDLSCK